MARARVRHRCPRTENAVTTSLPAALAASARHGFRRAARRRWHLSATGGSSKEENI